MQGREDLPHRSGLEPCRASRSSKRIFGLQRGSGTFEFQGHVTRDQLGLVLGVIDRNRDGWGEILFLQSGYEGFSLSVRSYSRWFRDGGPCLRQRMLSASGRAALTA